MAAARSPSRRLARLIVSHFTNRRFGFSVACVSLLGTKAFHLHANFSALSTHDLFVWGPTFFAQDVALLMLLRLLLDPHIFAWPRWLQVLAPTLASVVVAALLTLASSYLSFFTLTGRELQWRGHGAPRESQIAFTLSGFAPFILASMGILLLARVVQDLVYFIATIALDILKKPVTFLISKVPRGRLALHGLRYRRLPKEDIEEATAQFESKTDESDELTYSEPAERARTTPTQSRFLSVSYLVIGALMLALCVIQFTRPKEALLIYMSWAVPILPFVARTHSSPVLAHLRPVHGTGINWKWDNVTAVARPEKLSWLPKKKAMHGFEDWHGKKGRNRYRGSADPMRISNMKQNLHPGLREKLKDLKIRHVMLLVLENARKDVFPFKKNGVIWEKLQSSFPDGQIPENAQKRLASLTPTANLLTGDYDDGFTHVRNKRRGGINANNAYTSSTSSLKSVGSTLCGVSPLVADTSLDKSHHIYQPCLPHVLDVFNELAQSKKSAWNTSASFPWTSSFMQSVTPEWEAQGPLIHQWGFQHKNPISEEWLKSNHTRTGTVNDTDNSYYGTREPIVEEYVREAFASAKKNKERLFLTHLTSTGHQPFTMPNDDEFVSLSEDPSQESLSNYVNSVGSVDQWLSRILDVLDEQDVANETLVVVTGDHGLSIAEDGSTTPDYNTNVGNFRVPLVFSHPDLPSISVNQAATSLDVLPTILDLLLESDSILGPQRLVAHDMLRNYEGQSLLRPMVEYSEHAGQASWQFTVVSPGEAMVAVRDARRPNWRLIVPIVENTEWRFTDLWMDPLERDPALSLNFVGFLGLIEHKHGIEQALWAEEAAFITRWWVQENRRRWRYDFA